MGTRTSFLCALAAFVCSLFLSSTATLAQDADDDVDCANAVTQVDLNICAGKDYAAADAELNRIYREAMKAMEATDKELGSLNPAYAGALDALKRAQRAWIPYRDGQCELAGFEARGGTLEPMLVAGCLSDLTRKRTEELKSLVQALGN
ncbi:lysozyme inhibitor LprI family protein [Rhizobium sp. ARZ01]|uniref:lysozyme inhibitor LprI family protein n=1 Tax=Rhizobium sp. ARZ01 TaxID=2769313 RepID=UPI0017810079|nr:lysozyme inhibitor LprI family protein [Rhizobium sp. ARZ01]MBD9373352.1 lysozyme inhibitor LprI family protein [Rhizobium sp. ARZ01]